MVEHSPEAGGGDITKEPMWTFDADYVSQHNGGALLRTTVSNAARVFYNCSELRDLRQTSTQVPWYGTNTS